MDEVVNIIDSSDDEVSTNARTKSSSKDNFDPPFFEKMPEIDETDKESLDSEVYTEFVYTSGEFVKEEMEKHLLQKNRPEYEVEEIIDKREKMGTIEYLIKWKDYSEEHDSWVPESLLSCDEILAEFEEKWNYEFNEYLSKLDHNKKPKGRKHKKLKSEDGQCSLDPDDHQS